MDVSLSDEPVAWVLRLGRAARIGVPCERDRLDGPAAMALPGIVSVTASHARSARAGPSTRSAAVMA
jgi:hypothetical protein